MLCASCAHCLLQKASSRVTNNVVLQLSAAGDLTIHQYPNIEAATEAYFNLEKHNPDDDIVLVRAKTFESIRSAYRNYFQNTNEFIKLIEIGVAELSVGKLVI